MIYILGCISLNPIMLKIPITFTSFPLQTGVLAGDNVWHMLSVQKQFMSQDSIIQIPNTRLVSISTFNIQLLHNNTLFNISILKFIIPAYLQSDWSVYCWDMKRKIIHMCDPMADALCCLPSLGHVVSVYCST